MAKSEKKVFIIFAGINGAGKTTFYHSLKNKEEYGLRLNSDEMLQEDNGDWQDMLLQMKYGHKVLTEQEECLEKGLSFNRETTLSGLCILNTIKKAKSLGYKIKMIYIGLENIELAKSRVEQRVMKGGHGVPDEIIERRYSKSLNNLVEYAPYCDEVFLYDNSGKFYNLIAKITNNKVHQYFYGCKWANKVLKQIKNHEQLDINYSNEVWEK